MKGASQYRLRVRMKVRSSEKNDMATPVQNRWRMVQMTVDHGSSLLRPARRQAATAGLFQPFLRSYARLPLRTQVVAGVDI
jgi:hypothetical protein